MRNFLFLLLLNFSFLLSGQVFATGAGVGSMNLVATQVANGLDHTCALVAGTVRCWGRGSNYGQLGNGAFADSLTPVVVTGLNGVRAISAGTNHTCALVGGGVKCWGYNGYGQLGNNSISTSSSPVTVLNSSLTPLTGVVAIFAGAYHNCAILTSTGIQCWGDNASGQLGDGTLVDKHYAVAISSLASGVISAGGGSQHSCAVLSAGTIKCWGSNSSGQVGDGTLTNRSTPVAVSLIPSGAKMVFPGISHTCALVNSGVQCWGDDTYGQLGNGNWSSSNTAVTPIGSGVIAISSAYSTTCALMSGGTVQCWGDNTYAEIDSSLTNKNVATSVSGLGGLAQSISTGPYGSCIIQSGRIKCWGYNYYGQLGDGTTTSPKTSPVTVNPSALLHP